MELFKMAKEALSMRSKLSEIEKKLKSHVLCIEYNGVKVQVNAKNEFQSLELSDDLLKEDKSKIEKSILEAFTQATKKAQEVMADEAKKITGGMKFPGM